MLPADLPPSWFQLAEQQEKLGAPAQACTLRFCAGELERALEDHRGETLNLQQAAEESGYSADHLGRLVREGTIPNAGRHGAPRIARRDLPIKPPSPEPPVAKREPRRETTNEQIVQCIIAEGVG